MKPIFSTLREKGYDSVIYVDDSFLQGETYENCMQNIRSTMTLLQNTGFVIHPEKSVLIPTKTITFLGFEINSVEMTVTLTAEKKDRLKSLGEGLLRKNDITIRMVSSFIGNITASFEAVPFGRLHYRNLEYCKTEALKASRYNFDSQCRLNDKAITEIKWWVENITDSFSYINNIPEIDKIIYTDASKHEGGGWGAYDKINGDINGRWSVEEQQYDINYLELKAIKLALCSYVPCFEQCYHVRIMSDNTSAISYINKQGGTHNLDLNDLAVEIWNYCIDVGIYISAAHIPGRHNKLADEASRKFQDASEWMLCPKIFKQLTDKFGIPEIDLFASRLNHQLPMYASWKPDPESAFIDAMQIKWTGKYIYAFPPFSMIWPILTKIRQDRVQDVLMVVPQWPTQSWYPTLMRMRKQGTEIRKIASTKLRLPGTNQQHPLAPKLQMIAVRCSHQVQQNSY